MLCPSNTQSLAGASQKPDVEEKSQPTGKLSRMWLKAAGQRPADNSIISKIPTPSRNRQAPSAIANIPTPSRNRRAASKESAVKEETAVKSETS